MVPYLARQTIIIAFLSSWCLLLGSLLVDRQPSLNEATYVRYATETTLHGMGSSVSSLTWWTVFGRVVVLSIVPTAGTGAQWVGGGGSTRRNYKPGQSKPLIDLVDPVDLMKSALGSLESSVFPHLTCSGSIILRMVSLIREEGGTRIYCRARETRDTSGRLRIVPCDGIHGVGEGCLVFPYVCVSDACMSA